MVKPRGQHHQQIIEQQRLEFQIELNCLVVQLHIGHLERSEDAHSEQEFDCGEIQMKNRLNFHWEINTLVMISLNWPSFQASVG